MIIKAHEVIVKIFLSLHGSHFPNTQEECSFLQGIDNVRIDRQVNREQDKRNNNRIFVRIYTYRHKKLSLILYKQHDKGESSRETEMWRG